MNQLPIYVYLLFGATVIFATWLFYRATNKSKPLLAILVAWMIVQSALAISGFYNDPVTAAQRFPLLVLPPFLFLLSRFASNKGRAFLDDLHWPTLTLIHIIRIPVEIVLFWLFINKAVPEAVTFHGRNFDILSGITAPIVYYFGFVKKRLSKPVMIAWNLACFALLINVVSAAILSLPGRYAQFGFEQPNIALGFFPFVLLPAVLVPMVVLSTVAAIKQLSAKRMAGPDLIRTARI